MLPHGSLGTLVGREVVILGGTVWKEAGGFLLLLWAHWDERCPWSWVMLILGPGTCRRLWL